MRITGGEWARRKVQGPRRGEGLRPTPDVLREQAFAVLAPHLGGVNFLDLFAGTGVNALEALSRGAARAVLVECEGRSLDLLRRNLALLEALGRAEVVTAPADAALKRLARQGERFSLCWCDPPFARWGLGLEALALARSLGVLPEGGLAVLEAPPRRVVEVQGLEVVRVLRGAFLLRVR